MLQYLKKNLFCPLKHKNIVLKSNILHPSLKCFVLRWPKTSPNIILCSLKMAHCGALHIMILPGFKELGSITTSDYALEFGQKEIADMILKKVKEDKGNKKCDYPCPSVKTGSLTLTSCFYPDLMEGTNK